MIKKLLNSLPERLLCASSVLLMVAGLFVDGAQPVAVGLLTAPWDKLAHATVFAVGVADELHQATLPGRAGWRGWMICWRMR